MRNSYWVLGLSFFLILWWGSLVMGTNAHPTVVDINRGPAATGDGYDEAVKSLGLLSSFFNDTEASDIFPVSRHGRTYAEAYQYLAEGFSCPLAEDILSAYTFTDNQGTLRIIPCEGIPYLTADDRKKASITGHLDNTVIIVPLTNCYQPGDTYIYQVTSRLIDGHWKITDLSLSEK